MICIEKGWRIKISGHFNNAISNFVSKTHFFIIKMDEN